MSKVIFLDAGHGGIDPSGTYTTAPSKMYDHKKGNFHNGSIFYEGVKNREYCRLIQKACSLEGITVIPVYHPYLDTPLSARVKIANEYHKNICKGVYVSEHSNAANAKAKGFSVWTSIGQTQSDLYAEMLLDVYKQSFEGYDYIRIREEDYKDGDGDYEENFKVLRDTSMPAILTENLFFDNFDDASLLMSETYKMRYVSAISLWLKMII